MIKYMSVAGLLLLALQGCSNPSEPETANQATQESTVTVQPPVAKKVPHKMQAHGYERTDNYYWMRDDKREDKEVLAHLEAENAYKEAVLAPTKEFQQALYDELVGRMQKDDSSVPVFDNGYWYYRRYEGDLEYPIYSRKKASLEADEEILLDGNKMAEGHEYFAVGDYAVSTDNNLLAYSTDTLSRRIYTVAFRDLSTGEVLSDVLEGTTGQVVWANDNKSVFYIKKHPETLLGYQVYRHTLGTPQTDDVLMYEEDDTTFYTWIGKTKDKSFITIYHSQTIKSGVSLIDANAPEKAPVIFYPIEDGHEYSVSKVGDEFYIRTNWDATNFRVMKVAADKHADRSAWVDVVPHRDSVFVQGFEVFENHLAVSEKENGLNRMVVTDRQGDNARTIPFDDDVFVSYFSGNVSADADHLRVYYTSLTTPGSVYDIDLESFEKDLKKQDKVLGDFDPANYASKRISIAARDGKMVPVSLVYHKGKYKQDGSNPLYQYAYGSYGSNVEPTFRSNWLSLLDRGFLVAVAHIRGSQTLGRPWYEDGKMRNKKNTFTDFIDVTKGLLEQNYADKDKVFAMGGSAGGLLMGAVANMAPEMYTGIISYVPFVDVVTTMSDPSIPLTTGEWDEWGNPIENKGDYEYMLSYSPYDQVEAKDYPHMLVVTGLHDSQVQYFEPMKWVAKLREMKTDDNQLLFHTDMDAGHGGASGRFKRNKQRAMEYAWMGSLVGITE